MTIQQNLEKNWTNHRNECNISSPSLKFFMNIIHYNSAKEIVKYFPNIKPIGKKSVGHLLSNTSIYQPDIKK